MSSVKTIGVRDDHSYAVSEMEDNPNDPGDKLNDLVNSVLVLSSQDNVISKGTVLNIIKKEERKI